jgi:hypothetical protein
MFTYLENNWLRWYYDDNPYQIFRTDPNQIFNIDFTFDPTPCLDLRTECIRACQSIRDHYPTDKFSLMLSGGSESEMLVRSFKAAGVPFDVYIGRYENKINAYDVEFAVKACESIGVPYTFLDFNLKHFFDNDVANYSLKSEIASAGFCCILALTDMVDGIPILGDGNPELWRLTPGYDKPSAWINVELEYDYGRTKYFIKQNRPGISDWLRWSHRLLKSYAKTKWFNQLITNQFQGKRGVHSTKIQGYQEAWPELLPRVKKHGFELIPDQLESINMKLIRLHNGYNFTQCVFHPIQQIYSI